MIRECVEGVVEVGADPDIDVAHVRLGDLADAPPIKSVLELADGEQEVSDCGRDVADTTTGWTLDGYRLGVGAAGSMIVRDRRRSPRRRSDGCTTQIVA